MSESLFFVPMIGGALQEQDPVAALGRAFSQIEASGREAAYQRGYRQFVRFMERVHSHLRSTRANHVAMDPEFRQELLAVLAPTTSDEDLSRGLMALAERPASDREVVSELLAHIEQAHDLPDLPALFLTLRDEVVATLQLEGLASTDSVSGIGPGRYELKADTGQILWAGTLTERDVLWSVAFPGRPFELAADSGQVPSQPTREIQLLEGALFMRVYAGLEGGVVQVEHVD